MIEGQNDDRAIEQLGGDLAALQKRAVELAAAGNRTPSAPRIAEIERELADATSKIASFEEQVISLNPGTVAGWLTKAAVLIGCLRDNCVTPTTVHAAARVLEADASRIAG